MERRSLVVTPGQRAWARGVLRARRQSLAALARDGDWLVLAPHPDDETLGAGGLLAVLAEAGARPHVAFLTDGAGSHPDAPGWGPRRIAAARAGEAGHALRVLGVDRTPLWLGWHDAAPSVPGSPAFRAGVRRLLNHCRRHRIRRIVTTWGGEPHCDHAAAAALARALVQASRGAIRRASMLVWGWTLPGIDQALRRTALVSIDVAAARGRQRRAIASHRTQTGTRIRGAADAFRLPRAMIGLVARPRLLLIEEEDRHAA